VLDAFGYRRVLVALLGRSGFAVERTDEPDIAASPANVLLARVGRRVPPARRGRESGIPRSTPGPAGRMLCP